MNLTIRLCIAVCLLACFNKVGCLGRLLVGNLEGISCLRLFFFFAVGDGSGGGGRGRYAGGRW